MGQFYDSQISQRYKRGGEINMPLRRNKHWPTDIQDLYDIFYGGDYDRRKKYLDSLSTVVLFPQNEEVAKQSISSQYNVKRIPEKDFHTPDFIIESEKIVIEVTTFKSEPSDGILSFTPMQAVTKINEAMFHIDLKKEKYEDYFLVGYMFISTIVAALTDLPKKEFFLPILKQSVFTSLRIDALYIRVVGSSLRIASANGTLREGSATDLFPPFIVVKKNAIRDKIARIFPGIELVNCD